MKLKEIREKYLSLKMTTREAESLLGTWMCTADPVAELLDLWITDEWERSVKHGPGTARGNGGRG